MIPEDLPYATKTLIKILNNGYTIFPIPKKVRREINTKQMRTYVGEEDALKFIEDGLKANKILNSSFFSRMFVCNPYPSEEALMLLREWLQESTNPEYICKKFEETINSIENLERRVKLEEKWKKFSVDD